MWRAPEASRRRPCEGAKTGTLQGPSGLWTTVTLADTVAETLTAGPESGPPGQVTPTFLILMDRENTNT